MTSDRPARILASLIGLLLSLPSVAAASPAPSVIGVDPVAVSPFHDPVVDRSAEAVAAAGTKTAPAPAPEPAPRPGKLATVGDVELLSISPRTLAVGFHEGSTRSLALTPVGTAAADERGVRLPEDTGDGHDYVVMGSRGRATAPTSAVDVALPEGAPVASPVTGTVVDVSTYALYGGTMDVMIRIRPESNPDVMVTVFHVVDPAVGAGDAVTAGETELAAGPRPLPFGSQIDKWVGHPGPHVHIQIESG